MAPGSPAIEAGLCAHADYVIGTPLGIMRGEQDLYDLVEDYIADELPLHVYNANTNEVREVQYLVCCRDKMCVGSAHWIRLMMVSSHT